MLILWFCFNRKTKAMETILVERQKRRENSEVENAHPRQEKGGYIWIVICSREFFSNPASLSWEWAQDFQDTRKNNLIKEENSTLCEVDFAVFIRLVPSCLQSAGNGRRQFGSAKYDGLVESKKKSPLSHQPLLHHFIAAIKFFKGLGTSQII